MRDIPDGELRPKTTDEKKQGDRCKGYMQGLTVAFKKLRNNWKLDDDEDDDTGALQKFIDECTTVSIHENTVGKAVAKIAKEVNKHHHTKTCRKHDTTCRFGYPRFPKEKALIKYRQELRKVQDTIEDEDAIQKIMEKCDKQNETKEEHKAKRKEQIKELCKMAGVSYNDYIGALSHSKSGYSVVLQRDLDEIYINPYNIEWLRAWDGNMDIQVVLDYFAVITYVTDYYSKDDT
jgi:hypothetical protein